jgi:hypothetical protein
MYYEVDVPKLKSNWPIRVIKRVRSLKNIALSCILKHNIRPGPYSLPLELCEEIIARKYRSIFLQKPVCDEFVYTGELVGIHDVRISTIIYDYEKSLYMNLVSLDPLTVRVLSTSEDKFLNTVLPDYIPRSNISYINIRQNPYCD